MTEPKTLRRRLLRWLRLTPRSEHILQARGKGPVSHVIILDGTMSSMVPGWETNAGLTYRLLQEVGYPVSLFYEAGVQLHSWRNTLDVMMGRGINRQIRRAYGFLASRYHPGDKIYLIGYSRGAFGVRSLAGIIDTVGLLRGHEATVRNVRQAYRLYRAKVPTEPTAAFRKAHCYDHPIEIEMIGVWDTVKALGVRLPYFWRFSAPNHEFHHARLGPNVKHGFHALALDETRKVFEPVMWSCHGTGDHRVVQMWFRGAHGDVGGMIGGFMPARFLSNIPLVWMLQQLEGCGVPLPRHWHMRYPTKASAPSVGTWMGWGKIFLIRGKRAIGTDRSEHIHPTAAEMGYTLPDRNGEFDEKSRPVEPV